MTDQTAVRSSERLKGNKRLLTPEINETLKESQLTKKIKKSSLIKAEMEDIKKFIAEQLAGVSKQITDTKNALDQKISSLDDDLKNDLSNIKLAMDSFSSNVTHELSSLKSEIIKHDQRINNNTDDIDRIQLLNQLRVTGVPSSENEDLKLVFDKIAIEIGYDNNDPNGIPLIRRIPLRKNGLTIGSNTIILYFVAQHFKDKFYSLYLHKAPLKSDLLGNNETVRIGENLTKHNAAILRYCALQKKENKIAQAYTSNGLVYIKFKRGKTEKPLLIRNTYDIDYLIEMNQIENGRSNNGLSVEQTQALATNQQANSSTNSSNSTPMNS